MFVYSRNLCHAPFATASISPGTPPGRDVPQRRPSVVGFGRPERRSMDSVSAILLFRAGIRNREPNLVTSNCRESFHNPRPVNAHLMLPISFRWEKRQGSLGTATLAALDNYTPHTRKCLEHGTLTQLEFCQWEGGASIYLILGAVSSVS